MARERVNPAIACFDVVRCTKPSAELPNASCEATLMICPSRPDSSIDWTTRCEHKKVLSTLTRWILSNSSRGILWKR